MPGNVEFFFDLSSPWTWIAFHNIQPILAETGASVVWRPFLVGGVFNAVNNGVYTARQEMDLPKHRHIFTWMHEWAELAGLDLKFPSPHHPLKSVQPMRFCCALEADQQALHRFARAAFEAYFARQENLDQIDCLVAIADRCGLPGARLAKEAQSDRVKARLREATQEAIDRGAFGSPTIFVNGTSTYFGNDQLPIVRAKLQSLASVQS